MTGLPLTEDAQRILAMAELEAELAGHSALGTEHLLVGLLDHDDGLTAAALSAAGAPLARLRTELLAAPSTPTTPPRGGIALHDATIATLTIATRAATDRGDDYVVPRDLLTGVLDLATGGAATALTGLGICPAAAQRQIVLILAGDDP